VNNIRPRGFVAEQVAKPDRNPDTLGYTELVWQLRWRRRVLAETQIPKDGKRIRGSWDFAVEPFA
jgi:hypothetical protein